MRGFSVDVIVNDERWSTDDHVSSKTLDYEWQINPPGQTLGNDLVVSIGICRNPEPEVRSFSQRKGFSNAFLI